MGGELGARIRRLRLDAGLTLESLSAQAGVSARTIGSIERGTITAPQQHTLRALLGALQVEDDERRGLVRLARSVPLSTTLDRATALTPPDITDFVGRSAELRVLERLLQPDSRHRRPIVISGAAGVGKTSTALESLRRARGSTARRLFVDLDGLGRAPLTPLQVLQSLLMQLSGPGRVPSALDEALIMWTSATRDEPVSVLLDDAKDEAQVRPALSGGSTTQVVVTARRPLLGLAEVDRVALAPLERSDSIRLLAHIVPPGRREHGGLNHLAERCDDLPLALRIAGNRLSARPALTIADFVAHEGRPDAPLDAFVAGDQAIHAALQRSYDRLDGTARTIFRSLSVLEGQEFDAALITAATAIDPGVTTRAMNDLVELGLVVEHGAGRYALRRLVRLFSGDQARRERDDVAALRRRAQAWLRDAAHAGAAAGATRVHEHGLGLDAPTTTAPPTATRRQYTSVDFSALVAEYRLPTGSTVSPAAIGGAAEQAGLLDGVSTRGQVLAAARDRAKRS